MVVLKSDDKPTLPRFAFAAAVALGALLLPTWQASTAQPVPEPGSSTETIDSAAEAIVAIASGRLKAEAIGALPRHIAGDVLTYFAQRDDAALVEKMMSAGISPDLTNSRGSNALVAAIATGSLKTVATLRKAGADLDAVTEWGTPRKIAHLVGSREIRKIVGDEGGTGPDDELRTAARAGETARIAALLDAGVNADAADEQGFTPLLEATLAGCSACARLLLEHGANADRTSADGLTALAAAVAGGNAEIAKILLDAGADPNRKSNGIPPLTLAAIAGHENIVELLLSSGADPQLKSDDGARPALIARLLGEDALADRLGGTPEIAPRVNLLAAVRLNDPEGVATALRQGADPNQKVPGGSPLLVFAAAFITSGVVSRLVDAGADVFARGPFEAAPVQAAFANPLYKERNRIAWLLAERLSGEELRQLLEITDAEGRSVLVTLAMQANEKGPANALTLAVSKIEQDRWLGEAINRPDRDGITPFAAAVLANNPVAVRAFIEAGATPQPISEGISLQDLARSRSAWDVLAELPDDRKLRTVPTVENGGAKEELQKQLLEWGYYDGPIDGSFGPASRAALTALLKEREKELIGMAGLSGARIRVEEKPLTDGAVLDLAYDQGNCLWRIVHWAPTTRSNRTRFVGCVKPTSSSWNANGFGHVEYGDGRRELILLGPEGWEQSAAF